MSQYPVSKGHHFPLGNSKNDGGINFALFSKHATEVKLYLYAIGAPHHFLEVNLDKETHKTGWIWHALIGNLPDNFEYAYRIDGPKDTNEGHRFNPDLLLSDPYAKSLCTPTEWGSEALREIHTAPRGRVFDELPFDWENDTPPQIPMEKLIIYEMHIRAYTIDPSSKVDHPGTFLGVIDRIPHLKELGVNAVELLPIYEFNECEYKGKNPVTQKPLCNFWGYSTINFFCPMHRYATSSHFGIPIHEFKTMVRELHKNNIEVILDVVYNHTAEGSEKGPTYSFRGIDNTTYYLIRPDGYYMDFSGCGNTVKSNHPVTADFIIDSLRYWVKEMHVDGFRFDLASVLTRDEQGIPLKNPPIVEAIAHDPVLAGIKLIAEAWDAHGLYQVGQFPNWGKWAEWNGKYRDSVRKFIKGTDGLAGEFAQALSGSENLYHETGDPSHSINFVTAHDGFSLYDMVCYQNKHNEENGEENRDGMNENDSWNCGHEGPTNDPKILKLREKQIRNLQTALFLSIGTPMLLMGDEYCHTRKGNNNTWCQDNELNWFLWDELNKKKDNFRFLKLLIQFRKKNAIFSRKHFLIGSDVEWHGQIPLQPDWSPKSRFVAYTLKDKYEGHDVYIAFNANYSHVHVQLPKPPGKKKWYKVIDTSQAPPQDFIELPQESSPLKPTLDMDSYSVIVIQAF